MQEKVELKELKKRRIKRIIAKESLIIIAIILVGVLLLYISDMVKNKQLLPTYELEFDDGKKYSFTLEPEQDYRRPMSKEELNNTVADLKKRENLPQELSIKSFKLTSGRISEFLGVEQKITDIRKSGFTILYFTYPLYLLIRFIIWAIKMLKEK